MRSRGREVGGTTFLHLAPPPPAGGAAIYRIWLRGGSRGDAMNAHISPCWHLSPPLDWPPICQEMG